MISFLFITPSVAHLRLNAAQREPSILFGVCSSPNEPYRLRVDTQIKTWMSNLSSEEVLFTGTEAPVGMQGRFSWEPTGCPDNHDGESCKEKHLLKIAWKRDIEWVWILNDDHYVFPTAVKRALQAYDPELPVILGTPGCGDDKCGGMCGGGGELISRGALKRMFEKGSDNFDQEYNASIVKCDFWGDLATSETAKHHGVSLESIRGVYGWHKETDEIRELIDAGQTNETAPLLFHYVSPEQMFEIHSYWNKSSSGTAAYANSRTVLNTSITFRAFKATYDAEVAEYLRYANSCIYSKKKNLRC